MSFSQEQRREALFEELKAQMLKDIAPHQQRAEELRQQLTEAKQQGAGDIVIKGFQDQLDQQQEKVQEVMEGSHYYQAYMKD